MPPSRTRLRAPRRPRLVVAATLLTVGLAVAAAIVVRPVDPGIPPAALSAGRARAHVAVAAAAQGLAYRARLPLVVRGAMPSSPAPTAGPGTARATASPTTTTTGGSRQTATPSPTPPGMPSPTSQATPSPSEPTATPPGATPPGATSTPIAPDFAPFDTVRLAPAMRLNGSGTTVDSLAFWDGPSAEDTLLLVTAKGNRRVEVWRWPFEGAEQPAIQDASFVAGSTVNGIVVDQDLDRAYVTVSRPASTIAVFALPGLAPLGPLTAGGVDLRTEPNLAMLTRPDGTKRLYATADDHVTIFDPEDGALLGGFPTSHSIETVLADDVAQALYLPDETRRSGVYAYHPDGRPFERGGVARFGDDGVFEADAEGITMYACRDGAGRDDGRGLLVVSDQKSDATDFEVFDRRSWTHLGRFQLDGVRATDGIASLQRPLPGHPAGLFAAANDDIEVVVVGWEIILAAAGVHCASPPSVAVPGPHDVVNEPPGPRPR